jgi:flagellar biosynthetic protein FliR
MVFAPLFSSAAIAPRIKAGFVFSMTILLAPAVVVVPGANAKLNMTSLLGELGVGLIFGLCLSFLNEALVFAGALLGMQFSFSLVNLMDPNSKIETPVLGQMLGWLGLLVMIAAGLDRSLIAAIVRSFSAVPVGRAVILAKTGSSLVFMASGIFMAGLQLAAPVIAAALTVEVTIALVARLSPQLPAMVVSVPLKTLVCYGVFIASLAMWPAWIERHFTALLDAAGKLMVAQ